MPKAERKPLDKASASSAEVSLPSSALSTSGAADTITVGITSVDLGERDNGDEDFTDGGSFLKVRSRSLSGSTDGGDEDGVRPVDKLSIEPSRDEYPDVSSRVINGEGEGLRLLLT